jgi:hypothetical protein
MFPSKITSSWPKESGVINVPDPHSMAAWIRNRIPNADPDLGNLKKGLKRKEQTHPKGR